jgi:6-pyruvoyltetrahydropterin/6-carboxytetrahydropterin synthase
MYFLKKVITVEAAHKLCLDYESKCKNLHGHRWRITVYCKSATLNHNGMVVDFGDIKKKIMLLDHATINDFIEQPTAENIAKFICDEIPFCIKVTVEETEGNEVTYEKQ